LVILDEVGRGTSTVDGRSIAQAVLEYLAQPDGPLTLFATHYHELTVLHELNPTICAYFMASKKTEKGILFLYQLIKGVADGSFGIEVARLADVPAAIIKRAQELCAIALAQENSIQNHFTQKSVSIISAQQELPSAYKQVEKTIQAVDIDNLTPRQALNLVAHLQMMLSED
jgi:DNA mismatch repair protein MutS